MALQLCSVMPSFFTVRKSSDSVSRRHNVCMASAYNPSRRLAILHLGTVNCSNFFKDFRFVFIVQCVCVWILIHLSECTYYVSGCILKFILFLRIGGLGFGGYARKVVIFVYFPGKMMQFYWLKWLNSKDFLVTWFEVVEMGGILQRIQNDCLKTWEINVESYLF